MAKIIDVTVPLSAAPATVAGDPPIRISHPHRIRSGHPYNTTRLVLGSHAGTHVDAPAHFLDGAATVDELPLEILLGKCRVVELAGQDRIERAELAALDLRDDLRLLLRTRKDTSHLSPDAASYLVQAGLKLVGIDSPSVDPPDSADYPAHHVLLRAGVVIVERLDLQDAEAGEYDLFCLPLRLAAGDGAPARVVLRTRT